VRNGLIDSFAGTQATYAPPHSPALQKTFHNIDQMVIGADRNLYYFETVAGQNWGGYGDNPPDDWPYGIRRIGLTMPGVRQTVATLTSHDGQELYGFDIAGRHLSTQDALTGATRYQFGYNATGILTSITDANGLITTVEHDSGTGLATAIVAPNGQRTELTITDDAYLATIDEPGGAHREFTYDSGGLLQTYKKPNQATASFTYDDMGRLVHEDMPGGGSWTLTRTGPTSQNVLAPVHVTAVSGEGKTFTCNGTTDRNGNVSQTGSGPTGLQSSRAITQAGVRTQATPDGMTWSVTQVADPRFGMEASLPATTDVTTPSGKKMTTTVARAVTMSGTNLASQVDTVSVNSKASTSTYNVAAKTITNKSPVGRQTVSTLDNKGRVVQVQAGTLAPTAYAYDSRGRLSTVTVGTGSNARVTTFGYDSLDRLKTVTDPLLRTQSYDYDDANRVTTQTFTDGSSVVFGYDANGNVTSVTPPGKPAHGFGFTPNDLMSSYTPPLLSTEAPTTYEYNLDKQPTVIHRPDGSTINFTYDSAGRLSTTTYPSVNGNVTVTRTYSPTTGKLSSVSTSDGQTITHGYDGRLPVSWTSSGTIAGSVSLGYSNDFQVTSEGVNGANSISFGYDNDGLLTSVDGLTITRDPSTGAITDATSGSVTEHFGYDSYRKPVTDDVKYSGTSLHSVTLVRDGLGRVEQRTETTQGVTTAWGYSYDSPGRLWQVMKNGVLNATYLYDGNGNRQSKATAGGSETATYDAQDRLAAYGNWAYTYTANGELQTKTDTTTGAVTTYRYDGFGNLRRVDLSDGRVIEYVVDAENRRIAKRVNGSTVRRWIYGSRLLPAAELNGSGAVTAHFIDGGIVIGGVLFRMVVDQVGSPRLIVNASTGAIAQRMDYDEFGNVMLDTAPGFQPFGYGGGIYDPDTGLVRFGTRDYDPVVGRWTMKDPIRFGGGDPNLYAACGSDPINCVDPTGFDSYVCRKPLDFFNSAGGDSSDPNNSRTGPDVPGNPLNHEFVCVDTPQGKVCGGLTQKDGHWWGPGAPSDDTYSRNRCDRLEDSSSCFDKCLQSKIESPQRPYYGLAFVGTSCQQWAEDQMFDCRMACSGTPGSPPMSWP
jgi:RHS repeat-associated protein